MDEETRMEEVAAIKGMPVRRNMHIKLKQAVPSGYPTEKMKSQLAAVGLNCEETSEERLKQYKEEVLRDFPEGNRQTFYIAKGAPKKSQVYSCMAGADGKKMNDVSYLKALGIEEVEVNGSWVIDDDAGGYRRDLCYISYAPHFDYLRDNFPGIFPGSYAGEKKVINEPTGAAIRDSFKTIAMTVCTTIKSGIQKADLESVVSTILGDNTSENPKDYVQDDVLYTYLVNGYDPETETAISVGVLAVKYSIQIKDYKDKSDHKDGRYNDAIIQAEARFVSYSKEEDIKRDIENLAGFQNRIMDMEAPQDIDAEEEMLEAIPIVKKKVTVHTNQPPANEETFKTGMPLVGVGDYADTMIFFCPDFENVGYIDNLESSVKTTYSRSVTVGFENTAGISISAEISMEMDFVVAKYGVKMGVSMSLTSAWNQSQTETLTFEVGPGEEAYLYQGKLRSIILRYNPANNMFEYINSSLNSFHSDAVKTTREPIVDPKTKAIWQEIKKE